jgi:hypothetical protein
MIRATTVRTTKRTHHVEYRWRDRRDNTIKDGRFHTYVATAEDCLREFHRHIQCSKELGVNRELIRPPLAPADYKITRLFAQHHRKDNLERATGDLVDDDYPIPATANPDLAAKPATIPAVETVEMPFFAETIGKAPQETP